MNGDKKRIYKNTVIYALRQLASILFPLISFAYASRQLGVTGIGQVNYTNSIANYFVILSGLGISTYAIRIGAQIRDSEDRINRFVTELFLINVISTVLSLLFYFWVIFFTKGLAKYKELLLCFSLLIPFTTLGIEWVYNIYEDFLYITIRSIIFQIISLILLLVFVKDENDILAYVGITVFSTVGSNVLNFIHARKYVSPNFRNINISQHLKPVFYLFGMTISTTLYTTMDTTMIGIISNDYQVGLYSAANKVSKMLILMIATVRTVSLPALSRYSAKNDKEFTAVSNEILCMVSLVVIPVALGGIVYSDVILALLSGNKYIEASNILRWLMLDVFLAALNGTLIYQYVLLKKGEKGSFIITLIGAIANLILNYFMITAFKGVGAAIATCLSELLILLIAFKLSYKYIVMRKVVTQFVVSLIASAPILIVRMIGKNLLSDNIILNIISIMICILLYFVIVMVIGHNVLEDTIKKLLHRR